MIRFLDGSDSAASATIAVKGGIAMKFRVRTSPPKGRNTWEPDMAAKVQANLFATVAMLAAASSDAEKKLLDAVSNAKAGTLAFPAM